MRERSSTAKKKTRKTSATKAASKKRAATTKAKAKAKSQPARKRAAAKPKPKPKATPKKRAAVAAPKAKAKAKKSAAAAAPKKKTAAKPKPKSVPKKVSVRAAAEVAVPLPEERPLTDEEREAMAKCAQTALAALAALDTDRVPELIVTRIGSFVDEVRAGRRAEPDNQDVRLGLGVLWGEQVRAQVGWRWVHLSYANGFASYALVPDDRAFACFPLNRLSELMRNGSDGVNTAVPLFDSIRVGTLPARQENAYLVIG
ncbi:MAG: hypothetical protein JWP87_6497 [Labilithrix sp.]|nr:hypothetical protein [Labilithrix sp.]